MRRSADQAARDVEAAINAAAPDLPAEMALSPPQYFKADTSQIPVLLISMTSTSMPPDKLYDLADTLMRPAVAQIAGVAQATAHRRCTACHTRLAKQSGTHRQGPDANDVANVLRAANVTSPQGIVSDGITQMTVTANDGLHTAQDFASLVIVNKKGVPVRLSDVATVTDGQQDAYQAAWFNQPARRRHAGDEAPREPMRCNWWRKSAIPFRACRRWCRPTCRSRRSSI